MAALLIIHQLGAVGHDFIETPSQQLHIGAVLQIVLLHFLRGSTLARRQKAEDNEGQHGDAQRPKQDNPCPTAAQEEKRLNDHHQPQGHGDHPHKGERHPYQPKEVHLANEVVNHCEEKQQAVDGTHNDARNCHPGGYFFIFLCTHSQPLEHIAHFDVEVAELAVVLLVEGGGPVDAEDKIVVHGHLEAAACRKVEAVETALVVESIKASIPWREVGQLQQAGVGDHAVVGLHHHARIHEGVETHIEILLADAETDHPHTELHIGEGHPSGQDTVAHDAADGVGPAQPLIHHPLHIEMVEVSVQVERTLARHVELRAQSVGKGEPMGDDGEVVPPKGIEFKVVERAHAAQSSIIGEEGVGMDAAARILLTVAGVEGEAAMQVGMHAAVGLGLANIAQLEILVVERGHPFGQLVFLFAGELVETRHIHGAHIIVQQAQTGIPVPGTGDGALQVGTEAEHVALELIVSPGLILPVGLVGIGGDIVRLVAVEAIEIAHLVGHIGEVHTQAVAGDEILGVIRQAEEAVLLGGVGSLGIEGVVILGIDGPVAKIIDIGEGAVLEAEVGIEGYTGQHTKCPARADGRLLARLLGHGRAQQGESQ